MAWKSKGLAIGLGLALLGSAAPSHAVNGPFSSSYHATEVDLSNLVGTFAVTVGGTDVSVAISGRPDELAAITVVPSGSALRIESSKLREDVGDDARDYALYRISLPKGTTLSMDRVLGVANVGDLDGDLRLHGSDIAAQVGNVKSADLKVSGSGKMTLGNVAGAASLKVSGSGDITAKDVDSATSSVSGSGTVTLHDVRKGLTAGISGDGDVKANSVNGPVDVRISGSGNVAIEHGRADPLTVRISGSGDFRLGGLAVNPQIVTSGSGKVKLGSYSGKLQVHGNTNLEIGP